MALELKDGGTYRSREGVVCTVIKIADDIYPFVSDDRYSSWTPDGYVLSDHSECGGDLIEEVTVSKLMSGAAAKASDIVADELDKPKLQVVVGHAYRDANGDTVCITSKAIGLDAFIEKLYDDRAWNADGTAFVGYTDLPDLVEDLGPYDDEDAAPVTKQAGAPTPVEEARDAIIDAAIKLRDAHHDALLVYDDVDEARRELAMAVARIVAAVGALEDRS